MIHLVYSNRTEALFEHFAGDLAAWRAGDQAGERRFEPAQLVLPNRNVETWLKRQLAARDGIAANFEVHFLRRFVGGLLRAQDPGLRLVDSELLVDLVLSVLLDEARLRKPALAPVRDYVHGGGDSPDALDLRRVQLALELARLFEEYGYSRAEMLAAWLDRPEQPNVPVGRWSALEAWQRAVFREIFGPQGILAERASDSGQRFLSLPDLLQRLPREPLTPGRPVFLFGVSYVANLFQRVLAHVAQRGELFVYTLNPCLEFWEDLLSGREVAARARLPHRGTRVDERALVTEEDPFHLEAGGDTPALVLWGRPGRENVRLLDQLSQCDFHASFEDPLETQQSLLASLQHDILVREPERKAPDPTFDFKADRSVRLLACPGVRREAEAVATEIWSLVREADAAGRPLRFSDIAVLVAGHAPESHFAHLASAFEERGFELPYTLEAEALASQSPAVEVARMLLELPFGRFTRAEVLRIASHPAVAGRFDAERAEWSRWCEELGIFHGADRSDHEGTYLEDDLHNWDQGLRRLALGAVMTGARSNDPRAFVLADQRYLPGELSAASEGSAAAFGRLARSLIHDARFARKERLTLPDWADFFARMVSTYVVARGDREQRELDRCLEALRRLGEQDLGGQRVSCRVAAELAKVALSSLTRSRGRKGDEGVVVSTLQPMRALPFKVVFVVGLSEGRFPAAVRKSELDLRGAQLRAGDVSPREQDQYMFLETLLCARERLYLSYVARHELTGEPLSPSPVVVELLRMIDRGYLPDAAKLLTQRVPLRRFEAPAAGAVVPPEAGAEAQVLALRRTLGTERLDRKALRARLPAELAARAEEFLRFAPPPRLERTFDPQTPVRVRLSDLRRFLECPLQGAARFLLRLEDDSPDAALVEDEPFEGNRGAHLAGQRQVFFEWLRHKGARTFEDLLDEWARPRIASGGLPAGILWQVERPALLLGPQAWEGLWREVDVELPQVLVHGFGAAYEHERVDERHDPLRLTASVRGQQVPVELVGTTGPVFSDGAGELALYQRTPNGSGWLEVARREQETLGAFLDHLAFSAAGLRRDGFQSANLYDYGDKALAARRLFAPVAPERARAFLTTLVEDLLDLREQLFPAEAVFDWRNDQTDAPQKNRDPKSFAQAVDEVQAKGLFVSQYGPLRNAADFPPPSEEEARRLAERRFGLYWELVSDAPEAGEEGEE